MKRVITFGSLAFQLIFILFLFLIPEAEAKIIYVGPDEEYDNIMYGLTEAGDGDTVMVRDGTYVQDIKVRAGVVLMAENRHGAVIGDGSDTRAMISIRQNPVDGAVIDGFKFLAGDYPAIRVGDMDAGNAPENCIIKNNLIEGRKIGIDISPYTSNTTITGNTITGCSTNAIQVTGVGDNVISDNILDGSGWSGIFLAENEEMEQVGSTTVRGNIIRNNKGVGIGIERWKVTMERNLLEGNMRGIATSSAAQALVIRDSNQVINNTETGIDLESNSQASIEDNLIKGNGHEGIRARGKATIQRNRIEENGEYGIRVMTGTAYITNNIIASNKIHGIELNPESEYSKITGNTISANRGEGIMCFSESAEIEDNDISSNEGNGVVLASSTGSTKVFNNTFTGNYLTGIVTDRKTYIRGNLIQGNREHGIWLQPNARESDIMQGNTISNSLGWEVFVDSGSSVLIRENTIEDDTLNLEEQFKRSGIYVRGSARIEGNLIRKINGAAIYTGLTTGDVEVTGGNTIQDNIYGIIVNTPARIDNNVISHNQNIGIMIRKEARDVRLTKNKVHHNSIGIYTPPGISGLEIWGNNVSENLHGIISEGEALMRSNTIMWNDSCGIWIVVSGIDLGTEADSGKNAILENRVWNIRNDASESVPAAYNYWGFSDRDSIDATILDDNEESLAGPVLFEPFLDDMNVGVEPPISSGTGPGSIGHMEVFPNPFHEEIAIRFTLRSPQEVRLQIIDYSGRIIRSVLTGEYLTAGRHQVAWDGSTREADRVPEGVYFVVLKAAKEVKVQKAVLLR